MILSTGVESLDIDRANDQVSVTGTMDVKGLAPYLREKLKRSVEVVPPPKKEDVAVGDGNKEADPASGGEVKNDKAKEVPSPAPTPTPAPSPSPAPPTPEKKEDGDGGKKEEGSKEVVTVKGEENAAPPKMEISKFEHRPLYFQPSASYMHHPAQSYVSHNYAVDPYNYHAGYANVPPPAVSVYPTPYYGYHPDPRLDAPQMFSDENPNACFIM